MTIYLGDDALEGGGAPPPQLSRVEREVVRFADAAGMSRAEADVVLGALIASITGLIQSASKDIRDNFACYAEVELLVCENAEARSILIGSLERRGVAEDAQDYVNDALATPEGAQLMALFATIKSQKVRRKVLELVRTLADDEGGKR